VRRKGEEEGRGGRVRRKGEEEGKEKETTTQAISI
jgi:hypothetical protein